MSKHSIRAYFPFSRVRIQEFSVTDDGTLTVVKLVPDQRYLPLCSSCKQKVRRVHSYHIRAIRDLPMAQSTVVLYLTYRKVRCPRCGIIVEHHDFVQPYARVTNRMAMFVFGLCQLMTVNDVAQNLNLSWDQVKAIDKNELKKRYEKRQFKNLKLLCVDEFSARRRHRYMTVIANYSSGEVLWVSEGRDENALAQFFKKLSKGVLNGIQAIAIDIWAPYIKAIKEHCPMAAIVFDLYHVVAAFNRLIDKVRNREFHRADPEGKKLLKGSKYLFLKNAENLDSTEKPKLREILKNNERLALLYLLKDYLKRLWQYTYRKSAVKFLCYWCELARQSGIEPLKKFAQMLINYSYGILNHCRFPIHTGLLEGINNKIKVLKRRAYGFHDMEYFSYKIIQATQVSN